MKKRDKDALTLFAVNVASSRVAMFSNPAHRGENFSFEWLVYTHIPNTIKLEIKLNYEDYEKPEFIEYAEKIAIEHALRLLVIANFHD